MHIRQVGAAALLIEVEDPGGWFAELWRRRATGELVAAEIVPAARNVLLDGVPDPAVLVERLLGWSPPASSGPAAGALVEIPVEYGGADLADVARLWKTSVRGVIEYDPDELRDEILYQIGALSAFGRVRYVKPHGALYNTAALDEGQASAVVAAVREYDETLPVLCQPGSVLARLAEKAGLRAVAEGFADRAYLPDGRLVPRSAGAAVLDDTEAVVAAAVRMAAAGEVIAVDGTLLSQPVESLCLHGDTPGAVDLARRVRIALTAAGVTLSPF